MKHAETRKPFLTVQQLCAAALGAALMAVCAWISIPTEVPFTLQTFGVCLVAGLLGTKCGTLSVLVYLLLGAVGLPVFAGFKGGLGTLLGVTGGYLVGFVFTALAVGLLPRLLGRNFGTLLLSMAAGLALCYFFGSVWFLLVYLRNTGFMGFGAVLIKCVVPFLLPDAVKITLAAVLVRRLEKLLPKGILAGYT